MLGIYIFFKKGKNNKYNIKKVLKKMIYLHYNVVCRSSYFIYVFIYTIFSLYKNKYVHKSMQTTLFHCLVAIN